MNRSFVAALLLAAFFSQALLAQSVLARQPSVLTPDTAAPTAPIPAVDPALFASFPALDVTVPTKPPIWPPRLTPPDSNLMGLCRDITGPIRKPFGSPVYSPSREAEPSSLRGAVELLAWAGTSTTHTTLRLEGRNSFRYVAAPIDPIDTEARPFRSGTTFEFMSARDVQGAQPPTAAIDRTLFSLYSPAKSTTLRGTVLMIPGMFGTPEGITESLAKRLREDGWAILRMWAHPARFTESMNVTIRADEPLDAQVAPWAAEIDQRAAETAYAAQAAFAHVFASRPELAPLPRISIGFSGGAMVMATVLAREPGAYSAAVMVGGGADFWLMNERSSYATFINALNVKYEGFSDVSQAKLDANQAYLDASTLDSFHTARHVGSTKVLLIHGKMDRAVPSPLGDVLWQRFNRPERWVRAAGHEDLFIKLLNEYDTVIDWIRTAAAPPPSP